MVTLAAKEFPISSHRITLKVSPFIRKFFPFVPRGILPGTLAIYKTNEDTIREDSAEQPLYYLHPDCVSTWFGYAFQPSLNASLSAKKN